MDMVPNFSLNNAHFFCESADVSRGFPSARPPGAPSWEFVWNRWLATPLRAAGLPGHCPHLLQARCATMGSPGTRMPMLPMRDCSAMPLVSLPVKGLRNWRLASTRLQALPGPCPQGQQLQARTRPARHHRQ